MMPDLFRRLAVRGEPSDVIGEQLFFRWAGFDAQACVLRDAGDLGSVGKRDRLADAIRRMAMPDVSAAVG